MKIIKTFLAMCQRHLDISYVLVTSAYALDKKEIEDLKKALSNNISLEKIYIHNHVDPSVIGGLKIKTHSITIDDTIRNKLSLMKSNAYGSKGED
jgi:F-type H+-transporting ATPase subunit delta